MDGSEGSVKRCSERLELLRLRALKLSTDARQIDATLVDSSGQALVVVVYAGARLLGTMVVRSTTDGETWHLCAECSVMAGLAMQADWLPEAARVTREVFTALVTEPAAEDPFERHAKRTRGYVRLGHGEKR